MNLITQLTDTEEAELNGFLARVEGGAIPNTEALDGFFAALACCPEPVCSSEYLPLLQNCADDRGVFVFDDPEAERFVELVERQWKHVQRQLNRDGLYLPLVLEDSEGKYHGNDWANGFLTGTVLRRPFWEDYLADENRGGPLVPIWVLAHENHPDPRMRPYPEPIDEARRQELLIATAAGVMHMHRDFRERNKTQGFRTGTRLSTRSGCDKPIEIEERRPRFLH